MAGRDQQVPESDDELVSGPERDGIRLPPWVWRALGTVVVVAAVALAGPGLLSNPSHGPHPTATPTPDVVPPLPPKPVAPLRWAPRGDLLGTDFAAAALARFRRNRPDVDRLLWAGSLGPGGTGQSTSADKVAVVAYRPAPDTYASDGVEIAALRVAGGSDTTGAIVTDIGTVRGPGGAVGFAWRGSDRHTRLLVLARPAALAVQVSPVIDYHRDGSISRGWQEVRSADGAAVADLGSKVDPVMVVRPVTAVSGVSPFLVDVHGLSTRSPRDIQIAGSRADFYVGPDPDQLVDGVAQAVRSMFDLHDADSKVIWDGHIATGRDAHLGPATSGRGALVLVRRHDGATFQVFVFVDHTGVLRSYSANPVSWADGDRLPYAFSTFDDGAPMYLLNPLGPGSITVVPSVGPPKTVPLDGNGVGVLVSDANKGPVYRGPRVVVHDPAGRVVLRSTLVDVSTVDAFGLYL
ncbi:MAG: hypothetical protein ACXV2H_09125 [Actinomycetes bacterium]